MNSTAPWAADSSKVNSPSSAEEPFCERLFGVFLREARAASCRCGDPRARGRRHPELLLLLLHRFLCLARDRELGPRHNAADRPLLIAEHVGLAVLVEELDGLLPLGEGDAIAGQRI